MSQQASVRLPSRRIRNQQVIDRELNRAQGRIRAMDCATALLLLAVGTLAYGLVVAGLDHWLLFSDGVRQFFLALFGMGVAAYLFFAVVLPFTRQVNPYFAARALEKSSPESKNGLVNWLDLRARPLAPAIKAAVQEHAASELEHANVEEAIPARWPMRLLLGFAGLVLVALAFHLFLPSQFGSLLQRAFYPFTPTAVPTYTRLFLKAPIEDEPVDDPLTAEPLTIQIRRNQPVTIAVEVQGRTPPTVVMEYQTELAEKPLKKSLRQPRDGEYFWSTVLDPNEIPNSGLKFRVRGGDGLTRFYQLTYPPPDPSVRDVQVTYEYPPYTRRPSKTQNHGNLKAMAGTQVAITCTSDEPLRHGEIELRMGETVRNFPMQVDATTGKEISLATPWTLTADLMPTGEKKATYRIIMVSRQDRRGSSPFYGIEVELDQAPWVDVRQVGQVIVDDKTDVIRLPANDVTRVTGRTGDDVAVSHARLRLRRLTDGKDLKLLGDHAEEGPLQEANGFTPNPADYQLTLDLTKVADPNGGEGAKPLAFEPGQKLEMWVEANDTCEPKPNVGSSRKLIIEITEPLPQDKQQEKKDQTKKEEQHRDQQKEEQKKQNEDQRRDQQGKDQEKKDQQGKDQEKKDQQGKDQEKKDQQGKDQEKKDQQGKDQEKKDQQGKDQEKKDQQGKDQEKKDQQGKDQEKKDQQGKDQEKKDQQGKDQEKKDQQGKDQEKKDQQGKDQEKKDQQGKDQEKKDQQGKDQEKKDQQGKDQEKKDQQGKDQEKKDQQGKDQEKKDQQGKDQEKKDQQGKDQEKKDQQGKDQEKKDQQGKDQEKKDQQGKDQEKKDQQGKDQEKKDQQGKDQEKKDQQGKDQEKKDQQGKDQEKKDQQGKDQEKKDQQGKDQEKKDQQGKDQEKKDQQGKDQEKKDQQGKDQEKKDQQGKDQEKKDQQGKDQEKKDQQGKDQEKKDQQGKDQEKKDQQGKDQEKKDQQGKDQEKKDQQGKDQEKKDQQGKDQEKKDQQGKDQEKKDQQGKDQEKKDQQGKDQEKKDQKGKDQEKKDQQGKDQEKKDQQGKDQEKKDQQGKDQEKKEEQLPPDAQKLADALKALQKPEKPGEPPEDSKPDEADPEHAKKATDLLLENFRDKVKKGEIDKRVLEKMKWTEKDARDFVQKYDRLRGTGKGLTRGPGQGNTTGRNNLELVVDPSHRPPPELDAAYREFTKKRAQQKQ